jgi:hypothetical protein
MTTAAATTTTTKTLSLHKINLKQKIYHVALKVIMAFIMVGKCHVSKAI